MSNPKILIVDDEPDVVTLIENALKPDGFVVVHAYDGIEALDLVGIENLDLILLDIMMPMMSGYQVCAQIKANPQTQHIPVVCITSAHAADAVAQSQRVGAATLITKPFPPAELLAKLKRHLPQAQSNN